MTTEKVSERGSGERMRHLDRSLIRGNLMLTPVQRLRNLSNLSRDHQILRKAVAAQKRNP